MKKLLTVILVLAALTACTKTETVYVPSTDESTTTVEETTTTPATVAPEKDYVVDKEVLFIDFIYQEFPDVIYVTDADLLETGYLVCQALDSGVTPYEIAEQLSISGEGDDSTTLLLTIVTGAATGILCPEYADVWTR